ncbi:MAG: thiamine-phosphate kinase [Rikenellaceae bacterium]
MALQFGEFSLISYIKDLFSDIPSGDILTIGDDCSVLPYSGDQLLVVTTDMLVEGVHFLRDRISAFELGAKSLAVNLSDVASMGASPLGVTLSIAVPSTLDDDYMKEFLRGVHSSGVLMLGGDTTSSLDRFTISVTALGLVSSDCLKLRSGARVGDRIYVTSALGDSAAGLYCLINDLDSDDLDVSSLIAAHHNPSAHLSQGLALGSLPMVHSMMDISDGVASDLVHILEASGCSARIDLSAIPISDCLSRFCRSRDLDPLRFSLSGGEDYSLLFTASDGDLALDFPVFQIGEIVESCGNCHKIDWGGEFDFRGFTHF